jgi:DNA-binding MarR family transcriptional regulator
MPVKKPPLDREKLIELINQESRELSNRTVLFHHWISEYLGLNTIDHKCLDIVVRAESPVTGVQLAGLTGLSSGAVTGMLDRLEKAGYVIRQRDHKDRRQVFVKPVMGKIEKELYPIFNSLQQAMSKIYSDYTNDELGVILDVTSKYNKVMQERTVGMMRGMPKKKGKQ